MFGLLYCPLIYHDFFLLSVYLISLILEIIMSVYDCKDQILLLSF